MEERKKKPILEHIYHNLVIHKPEIRQFDLQPSDNFKRIFAMQSALGFQ